MKKVNKEKQRTNRTNKILYQEDLGINFNGYPLEDLYLSTSEGGLDEIDLGEKVKEALEEHKSLRFHKNFEYEIVVEVRAKEVV